MQFEITLTIIVDAPSASAAVDMGLGIAEWVQETQNDDGSLDEGIRVEAHPVVTA